MLRNKSEMSHNCDYTSNFLSNFNEFRKNGKYCDFTIIAGENVMPVHKIVIMAGSKYFDAMVRHDMSENQTGVIKPEEVDPQSVVHCVDFMYSGKTPTLVNNPVRLLHAAHVLVLKGLCDHAATLMRNELNYENLVFTRKCALQYGQVSLNEACDRLAVDKFHEFVEAEGFLELDAENLELILSSVDLNVIDELKVKAILTWVKDNEDRLPCLIDLMKHIDIVNVELSYRKYLLDLPIVFKSPECSKFISKSIPEGTKEEAADYVGHGSPSIITMNLTDRRLERFHLKNKSWITMHPAKDAVMTYHCIAIRVGQFLYVLVPGRNSSLHRIRFTCKNAIWEEMSTPPVAAYFRPITHLNGMLYTVDDVRFRGDRINQYDITNNRWSHVPAKAIKTFECSLATARGLLFSIGGFDVDNGMTPLKKVECFNPVSSSWSTPVGNLTVARYDAACCTHNCAIYVFGSDVDDTSNRHGYVSEVSALPLPVRNLEILYPGRFHWVTLKLKESIIPVHRCYSIGGLIYLVSWKDESEPYSNNALDIAIFDTSSRSIINKSVSLESDCRWWGGLYPVEAAVM